MLRVSLFGNFSMSFDGRQIDSCRSNKAKELFSYLVLNRDRSHSREILADLLWGSRCTTSLSKRYLRKALWQLQGALNHSSGAVDGSPLSVDLQTIEVRSVAELWLDVAVFESAFEAIKGISGPGLKTDNLKKLELAVKLYKGGLLENWQQDWCLCERDRLYHIFLIILDKLTCHYESQAKYEEALEYCRRILRFDRARERTHRQTMRLLYLAGDRTGALRQFESCVTALRGELDVAPSSKTLALYEQMRQDRQLRYRHSLPRDCPFEDRDIQRIQLELSRAGEQMQAAVRAAQMHFETTNCVRKVGGIPLQLLASDASET